MSLWRAGCAGQGEGLPESSASASGHYGAQQADPELLQGRPCCFLAFPGNQTCSNSLAVVIFVEKLI